MTVEVVCRYGKCFENRKTPLSKIKLTKNENNIVDQIEVELLEKEMLLEKEIYE